MQIHLSGCVASLVLAMAGAIGTVRADDATPTPEIDTGATLITIHATAMSLSDILSDISKQSGMQVAVGMGNPAPAISFNADRKPFWKVLEELCKQTSSTIEPNWNGQSGLTLQFTGGQQTGLQVISGPVLLNFQGIQHVDRLTAAPEEQDTCEVTGVGMWESRLPVLFIDGWTAPTVAEDESGLSLVPDASTPGADPNGYLGRYGPYGQYVVPQRFNRDSVAQSDLHIRLKAPPTSGRRIKNLAGKWRLFIAGKTDHFDISPIASRKQSSFTYGDLGVMKMNYAVANDELVQLQFDMAGAKTGSDGPTPAAAMRNCLLQSMHARAEDAQGKVWGDSKSEENSGQISVSSGNNQTNINVYLRRDRGAVGKPTKVTIDGPVTATEIDAPFELHDLPLP